MDRSGSYLEAGGAVEPGVSFPWLQLGVIGCLQGLPDLLVAYAQAGHPCPTLLPLVCRAAEAASASGALSPRRLAWLRQSEARLLSVTKAG